MEDEVDAERLYNPRLWPRMNEVRKAFDRCAARVRRFKDEDGVGIVDPGVSLRPEERDLLLRSASMLPGGEAFDSNATVPGNLPDPRSVRHAHLAAVDILAWDDPVRAILYAAVQVAAHGALIKGGLDEEKITEAILAAFGDALATFETAYGDSGCKLPPGRFLHACTASMQVETDELGADLAIVVGTNVLGAARYRLVLVQAKRMGSRCTADVGHKEGGQLDELLSSGMGFYLFYPEPIAASARQRRPGAPESSRMLPTVRSAEAVFREVWTKEKVSYTVNCYADASGKLDAVDFAEFVTLSMTGWDELEIGRLFPDIDSVIATLRLGGRPLASRVLAISQHGELSIHELIVRLRTVSRRVEEFRLPELGALRSAYDAERKRSDPKP